MRRGPVTLALLVLATSSALSEQPLSRVVSLDYCSDQYALELLPAGNILALSPDAETAFSYHRESAIGIPTVRPVAEDVIALDPAAIIRSYGGGPRATEFFSRAGIPVIQVPYVSELAGVAPAVVEVAGELGVSKRGAEVVEQMERRLAGIDNAGRESRAIYVTAGGATSGTGTLIDEMLAAAGFENFNDRPGWFAVPLERLAYDEPDAVAAAFFDGTTELTAYWSSMRHPVARRQLAQHPTVMLPGAWTSCGGWFLVDAIEALANLRDHEGQ